MIVSLESDLCRGTTLAIFRESGKIPDLNEQFINEAGRWAITSIEIFARLGSI